MTFSADYPAHPTTPWGPDDPGTRTPREVVLARRLAFAQTVLLLALAAVGYGVAFGTHPHGDDGLGEGLTVIIGVFSGSMALIVAGLVGVPAHLLRRHRPGSRTTLLVVEWLVVVYGVSGVPFCLGSPSLLVYLVPSLLWTALGIAVVVQLTRPATRLWCAAAR